MGDSDPIFRELVSRFVEPGDGSILWSYCHIGAIATLIVLGIGIIKLIGNIKLIGIN